MQTILRDSNSKRNRSARQIPTYMPTSVKRYKLKLSTKLKNTT